MPGVSREQIEQAKRVDVLSYLQTAKPDELIMKGREYCLRSHDSMKINPSNGLWNWHSRGIGGRTALDYLIHVEGIPFVEAVHRLCDDSVQIVSEPQSPLPAEKRCFSLPTANNNNFQVESYLLGRGIALSVIQECFRQGILYESAHYHNAVFVGRDSHDIPRHAALRGTEPGSTYKADSKGSDKRFPFSLPGHDDTLLAFESAIDLLSYITLTDEFEAASLYRQHHYLSLAGLAPIALRQYLHDHPDIRYISFCFDADEPGRLGADAIKEEFQDRFTVAYQPPAVGKDYNDMLLKIRNEPTYAERGDSHDR